MSLYRGESGCGKTTTLLEIMEFHPEQTGEVVIGGVSNKSATDNKTKMAMRKEMQMVFQDPTGALDPRFTVYEVLAEPLENLGMPKAAVKKRIMELMRLVGLQPDHVNRFPNQFSGGQRQRIGIARALAVNPKLVVLDEPVSALDVSVQAGVINLLDQLRAELGLSYLMVAHDLSVVRHISNRVAVMYLGKIVETGDVDDVFDNPGTRTQGPCCPRFPCRIRKWNAPANASSSKVTCPAPWTPPRDVILRLAAPYLQRFHRPNRRSALIWSRPWPQKGNRSLHASSRMEK